MGGLKILIFIIELNIIIMNDFMIYVLLIFLMVSFWGFIGDGGFKVWNLVLFFLRRIYVS